MEKFDTLIIGGGPAGLIAAINAASHGQNVAIAEKNHSCYLVKVAATSLTLKVI